jgi:hypothetical protein
MDPLLIDKDLPFCARWFPVGFRIEIATNSRDVIEAAEEAWGHYEAEYACETVVFRVVVQAAGDLAPKPAHRAQGHLYSVISDANNFANLDLKAFYGSIFVSQKTAADHTWLRWFFVESLAYTLLAQRYIVPVHAACAARNGSGVLLCGPTGSGKSTLSFGCARAGWTFITDDCTWLLPDTTDRMAIGRPRQARFRIDAPELFPELETYVARARPNGKVSIEIPMSAFPSIKTDARCPIEHLVFLDRSRGVARFEPISSEAAINRILDEMPSYGAEVNAMHERTVRRLAQVPAYHMKYDSLEVGICLLNRIANGLPK